jgi:hypothetical protein
MERRGGFQKYQSVPHPVRALPNHFVDLLAIMLLIPYAGHEIHRAVGIGKTWHNRTDIVSQSVQCHCTDIIAPLPISRSVPHLSINLYSFR